MREISQRSEERRGDVNQHVFSTSCVPSSRKDTKGGGGTEIEERRRETSLLRHEHISTQESDVGTYLIGNLISMGKCPTDSRAT